MAVTSAWYCIYIKACMRKHSIPAKTTSENALQCLATTCVGIIQAPELCCPPGSHSHSFPILSFLFLSFLFLSFLICAFLFISFLFFPVPFVALLLLAEYYI